MRAVALVVVWAAFVVVFGVRVLSNDSDGAAYLPEVSSTVEVPGG